MKRNSWFVFALLVSCMALLSSCASMRLRPSLYYEKVPAVSFIGLPSKATVLGANVELAGRSSPESRWGWHLGGGYGFGGTEFEDIAGDTDESRLTSWSVYGGYDYLANLGETLEAYCGASVFYSASTQEFEQTGFPTTELEPYTFFGLQNRFGLSKPLSGNLYMNGEMQSKIGRATLEDEDNLGGTFRSWQMTTGFRGGFEYRFR